MRRPDSPQHPLTPVIEGPHARPRVRSHRQRTSDPHTRARHPRSDRDHRRPQPSLGRTHQDTHAGQHSDRSSLVPQSAPTTTGPAGCSPAPPLPALPSRPATTPSLRTPPRPLPAPSSSGSCSYCSSPTAPHAASTTTNLRSRRPARWCWSSRRLEQRERTSAPRGRAGPAGADDATSAWASTLRRQIGGADRVFQPETSQAFNSSPTTRKCCFSTWLLRNPAVGVRWV
jgi:hypothetical protein